jgi:hypothetical protein
MDNNGILSVIAIVVSIAGAIVTAINHTRVRSACCGRSIEVSLDIEKTIPVTETTQKT